ncbi:KEOPS complex subunit Pcc1 [Natrinema versiforme]|uniref:KEOPS complex Pcc1-like subunit n=1 Tax=Natrinema versiforme TaxID=88724 RepID=A0A4P8WID6_9EURY|nr:KEOPS complex subunit Pcc1 [Natrinema versiforme]QCS43180.1 KEOPS complex Pcc1-like subunit [Natrinema versiforme]
MSRRATIRTAHDDAALVARALSPDNTDEMSTTVETVERDGSEATADDDHAAAIVTRIDRETTSGLQSTVDDYVVNLEVAIDIVEQARTVQRDEPTDTGPVSDTDSDSEHDTTQ